MAKICGLRIDLMCFCGFSRYYQNVIVGYRILVEQDFVIFIKLGEITTPSPLEVDCRMQSLESHPMSIFIQWCGLRVLRIVIAVEKQINYR